MHKQMKLVTTAEILGLFLAINYLFELLSKIGAGIFSAVLTEQLTAEAWTGELYTAIWMQSLPFLVMIAIGVLLLLWARSKSRSLGDVSPEWALSAPLRRDTDLAVVGGLLAFAGLYNLGVPIYFGFEDLVAGLSAPDNAGYVLKAVLPNYTVLLVEIILGLWLMFGRKTPLAPVAEVHVPHRVEVELPAVPVDEPVEPVNPATHPAIEEAEEAPEDKL